MSRRFSFEQGKELISRYSRVFWVIQAIVILGIGFGMAWIIRSGGNQADSLTPTSSSSNNEHAEHEAATSIWTCSMHPQIRRDGPGKCPICGMELVPVKPSQGGIRTVTVSPAARMLMNVETAPVERRYVTTEIRLVGKVEFDETRLAHITAWVPGRLDRLFVDYTGIEVREGDHLVSIYSEELFSAQDELLVSLRRAIESEGQSRIIPPLDMVESSREKLRLLGLTPLQISEIEQRGTATEHMTIYSPVGGVVVEKLRQEGDRVRTGDRIYTVADLNQVWVKLDAYEADLSWIRYGQEVTFTSAAYPGETFSGRIAFIDRVLDPSTRTVKVRVNVDNQNGRLKPEMFVSAIIRSTVASNSRVLDTSLAGKWISPMHPEIVSDQPGDCTVCGMPLVRAESLGYTVAEPLEQAKPLVIPVSAAMITGTRAIVYVEDAEAEEPTFHGREILLGPRAGDYYLVRNGLEEGEVVVTNGSFKLDSALQISAKPSMMTPYGGGGGGGHNHSGSSTNDEHSSDPSEMVKLPESVEHQMLQFLATQFNVLNSIEQAELAEIRAAFAKAAMRLEQIDGSALSGHGKMLWDDFFMVLSNDVVEGAEIETIQEADRVYLQFQDHIERIREQFNLPSEDAQPSIVPLDFPIEFRQQIASVWYAYAPLSGALADDDFDLARQQIPNLQAALNTVDAGQLTDDAAIAWQRERDNLQRIIVNLDQATDLVRMRSAFALLSEEMLVLITTFRMAETGPVFKHHCPMAFQNRGASWLQPNSETRNPYFGQSMLKCANQVTQIAPF